MFWDKSFQAFRTCCRWAWFSGSPLDGPELALEPKPDLVAQLPLGLVQQAQCLVYSPLLSHQHRLGSPGVDALGKT